MTPDAVTLAEIRLALLGIGSGQLSLAGADAGEVRTDGRLLVTDAEGAPVAHLVVDSADEMRVNAHVEVSPGQSEPQPGPFASLRLSPAALQLPGAAAVVGHDPIDAARLAAASADPDRATLFVVLDGPRSHPGPEVADVARAALATAAELREAGQRAEVVVVPAPHYGDGRDDALADKIATAYGAERVHGDAVPDRTRLFRALDGAEPLPDDEWPAASLAAWRRWRPPRSERGLVLFFTGLSGSGKSTVARAVVDRLAELGDRKVTLLDGDEVRRHLSAGLGFSRADRDRNIERIGFVAAEVARHGGLAVCAPIAPFAVTRARVRDLAEAAGDFVLVHVATPLEECERRDRKGLYARARAGEIAEFTGISSPYEPPEDADLAIDTSAVSIHDARDQVLGLLAAGGWIPAR